jgi:membrane-associated phospholipid phosphatase
MLVSVALLAAITTVWKISIHCSVAAAAVTILTMLFGAWLSPAFALVVVCGWSRVELEDHTIAQVVAGSLLGVAAAIVSYVVIKG